MRVLVCHNLYRSTAPSGENQLVRAEVDLLRSAGVDVVEMLKSSDDIRGGLGAVSAAAGPVYSRQGVREFTALLHRHRPDVVHLHNVFPLISPWVVRVAAREGVPVVQTVHNYRHGCVNGLHLRDGRVCTDCLDTRLGSPAVQHGCYRGSRLQTVPMSVGQVAHRRTWQDGVDRYLALTPFMRDMLVRAGIPAGRIVVRPTWVPDPGFEPAAGKDVLFVGRLDEAKGVDRLLDAWRLAGTGHGRRLRIAGDGPLADLVARAGREDPSIEVLGRLDPAGVRAEMAACGYVVVPSRFFEGYPLVVAEAFGVGRPVLTVTGGSVGSIVDNASGWLADPTVESLAAALDAITDDQVRALVPQARSRFERDNSPERGLASLLDVYRSVVDDPARLAPRTGP